MKFDFHSADALVGHSTARTMAANQSWPLHNFGHCRCSNAQLLFVVVVVGLATVVIGNYKFGAVDVAIAWIAPGMRTVAASIDWHWLFQCKQISVLIRCSHRKSLSHFKRGNCVQRTRVLSCHHSCKNNGTCYSSMHKTRCGFTVQGIAFPCQELEPSHRKVSSCRVFQKQQ